jgi:AcrR family transcriptional regulator
MRSRRKKGVEDGLKRELTPAGRRIVQAVIECVAERGLSATRLRDVTTAAGTAEAAFYRFFTDLDQAVLYIIHQYWRRLNRVAAAYQRTQREPLQLLECIIEELLASHRDDPDTAEDEAKVFRIVVHEMRSPTLSQRILLDPEYRRFVSRCTAVIRLAQRQAKLSQRLTARLLGELLVPFTHKVLFLQSVPGVYHSTEAQRRQAVWQLLGRCSEAPETAGEGE